MRRLNFQIIVLIFSVYFFTPFALTAEDKVKFKLGVIIPLSGDLAFFGQAHMNTAKLLHEDLPKFAGRVEIIYEDSAYDAKKAVAAFRKLVSIDKVDAVFSFGGPILSVLAPLAENEKIPYFTTESEVKDAEGKHFVSLFRNEAGEFGRALWDELRVQKKTTLGIVKNQNQFMDTLVNGISDSAIGSEKVDILVDVPPGTTDFRSAILKLKKKKYDLLSVFLLPGSHRAFVSQAKNAGIKGPFVGVEQFLVPEENAGLESYIEGTMVVAPFVTEDFRQRYKKDFLTELGVEYCVGYYDFLKLLNQTVASMNNDFSDKEIFLSKMRFVGEQVGISGPFVVKTTSSQAIYYSFPIAIYKVVQGKLAPHRFFERPR
jgi:ABC-type branched-subunit amino acid transport system substrate-binding protein